MLRQIVGLIREKRRILVTTHVHPDGDGIGTGLALVSALRQLGKDAVFCLSDPVPFNYRFLPGTSGISRKPGDGKFDLTIVVDCAEEDRVGESLPAKEQRGVVVCIDHHLVNGKPFGDVCFRDETASAVGELVYCLLVALGVKFTPDIAECIYTSILSDTGSFRYSNTTSSALKIASEMLGLGVDPWNTALCVYETSPPSRLRLLAMVLETLEVDPAGRVASILVEREMFEKTGTDIDMIDGFINYARGIEGVEVAIQFREIEKDKYKVSFRSKGTVNVAGISGRFGGGGHFNAAGCTLDGPLGDVRKTVYRVVEEEIKRIPPPIAGSSPPDRR